MPDPVVYFFLLGLIARAVRSDLKLPGVLYEALSIYLLLAIGLKGGVELARHSLVAVAPQIVVVVLLGALLPLIAFPVLRFLGGLDRANAGAIAAHYGSVSVVTFAVCTAFLVDRAIEYERYMPLFVALLEAPGIVVGILLARSATGTGSVPWAGLLREILAGKSIVLLLGGLLIGWLAGPTGIVPIEGFFFNIFKGVLCLFLLEMGLVVGGRLADLRSTGRFLIVFGIVTPVAFGLIGTLCGRLLGLSIGGTAVLATLAASASYIAAPAATRMALPEADPARSLAASLGVTFPFNITLGIPLYLMMAQWIHG
jgi:hypothetical protein